MTRVCRYTLPRHTSREFVEDRVALGIMSAECVFGKARVRLEAGYVIGSDARTCAIDVATPVGEHVARIFTGLLIRDVGELDFVVERVTGDLGDVAVVKGQRACPRV